MESRESHVGSGGGRSPRRSGWARRLLGGNLSGPSLSRIAPLTHAFARAARLDRPLSEACRETSTSRLVPGSSWLLLLHPALALVARRAHASRAARRLLEELASELETGRRVADVLDDHPEVFPPGYRALVRAGEASGRLADAFEAADRWCEREARLLVDRKVRLIYPVSALSVLGIICFIILWKVLPTLTALAARAPAPAPLATRVLLRCLLHLSQLGPVFLVLGPALLFGLFLLATSRGPVRVLMDHLMLASGASGRSRTLVEGAIAFQATAAALRSGVPLPEAFTSAASVFSNVVLGQRFASLSEGFLREGRAYRFPVAPPLETLSAAALTMAVRSGTLPETFDLLATRAFQRVRHRDRIADAATEPAIVLALGGCVAVVVLGTYAMMFWLPPAVVP